RQQRRRSCAARRCERERHPPGCRSRRGAQPLRVWPAAVTATAVSAKPTVLARLLILPIAAYRRLISPFLGQRGRFTPTCSASAVDALQAHGAARGLWLSARRIERCQQWNPGCSDPVPPVASPVLPDLITVATRYT